jgi:hypothetical protein
MRDRRHFVGRAWRSRADCSRANVDRVLLLLFIVPVDWNSWRPIRLPAMGTFVFCSTNLCFRIVLFLRKKQAGLKSRIGQALSSELGRLLFFFDDFFFFEPFRGGGGRFFDDFGWGRGEQSVDLGGGGLFEGTSLAAEFGVVLAMMNNVGCR